MKISKNLDIAIDYLIERNEKTTAFLFSSRIYTNDQQISIYKSLEKELDKLEEIKSYMKRDKQGIFCVPNKYAETSRAIMKIYRKEQR